MNEQMMKSEAQRNQAATLDTMPHTRWGGPGLAKIEPARNIFAFIFPPLTETGG